MITSKINIVMLYLCYTATTIQSIKQSTQPKYSTNYGVNQKCSISEYTCANNNCISAAKFCDNNDDCGDASDEPRFCTKCNRTYHGNMGITYHMELHRPKEEKIPYICLLTFTAAGGMHGDIVQITIQNGFTLGKFVSFTHNGCQDAYLEFSEASRMPVGGAFCGQSWGPSVFYSETRSLVLSVKLFKLLREQNGYNFDFRIDYKFLSKEESIVRYGGLKSEFFENMTKETHHSSNNFDNKITTDTKNSEAYDTYEQEIASRINEWYGLKNNMTSYMTSTFDNSGRNYNNINNNNNYNNYRKSKPKLLKNGTVTIDEKYYLGDLIPGTYCSRIYSNCDKKLCRLQSPNYPGMYPRNLTCYYAVRQHDVPQGKHALITVKQPKGNLVWIMAGNQAQQLKNEKEKFKPRLQTWSECDTIQDYVTIYDGYTTRDLTVLKFCGGGQVVQPTTSSGPELLVEFTTSPYGTFNNLQQDTNLQAFNGFQLEVEVTFVDIQSPTYVKSKRSCEFWIRGMGHGVLENPKHTIAPNTTCLYHLQGTELTSRSMDHLQMSLRRAGSVSTTNTRFKVWLSILKFDYAPYLEPTDENMLLQPLKEDCSGMLRIFDGQLREAPMCKDLDCYINERDPSPRNARPGHNYTNVIARFCRGSIPRSCDHIVLNSSYSRPCTMQESFISSNEFATLELKVTESTALRPLNFRINYEFVDLFQDGQPFDNDQGCNRKFVSNIMEPQIEPIVFRSNRNVFFFGRSGAINLNCVYRFEAQRGERVKIVVYRMMSGNRTCESKMENDTHRSYCYGNNSAKVQIFERPWHDSALFVRNCICNSTNSSILPVSYVSNSREVEVHFTAINMSKYDDPDTLNFQATFEFIKPIVPTKCKEQKRKIGSEGTISLNEGDVSFTISNQTLTTDLPMNPYNQIECKSRPWLIEPSTGKYLYLSFRGYYLSRYDTAVPIPINQTFDFDDPNCPTKSRVIVTTADSISVTACPLSDDWSNRHLVEVFSAGWHQKSTFQRHEWSPALSVEFIPDMYDYNEYSVTWLELSRRPPVAEGIEDCQHSCPELHACVNGSIWCDGKVHCPSGYDESFIRCSRILRLPAEVLAVFCVILIVGCCACSLYIRRKIRNHCQRSSVLQTRLKSMSSVNTNTDTGTSAVFDEKDFIS